MTKKRDRKKKPKTYTRKPDDKLFRLTFGVRVYVARQTDADAVDALTALLQDKRVKDVAAELGIPKWEWKLGRIEKQQEQGDVLRIRKPLLGPDGEPMRGH